MLPMNDALDTIDRLVELLAACEHALTLLSGLSIDGEITMTAEGKDRILSELKVAINQGKKP